MASDLGVDDLQSALRLRAEKLNRPRSTVLFRRGERASGMFIVLRGKVSLDFGADSAFARIYGPGALVGLPATLTRRDYAMTATVTEDAELGYWSFAALDSLLRKHPEYCKELLAVLGERMAENLRIAKALMTREEQPVGKSTVV